LVACASPAGDEVAEGESELTGVAFNDDSTGVVIWSQNLAQFGHPHSVGVPIAGYHWKNIIRCATDPSCNGFGVVPDVFAFQEASREMCEVLDNELERQLNGGAEAWDWHAVDNWTSSSAHWLSGCILYRRARFDSASRVVKNIPTYETNPPAACRIGRRPTPSLKLKDTKSGKWLSLASFHEDHFAGPQDTCDDTTFKEDGSVLAYDSATKFCNYLNMKKLGAELPSADVQVLVGDANYTPFNCGGKNYARCHWKAIVAGQGTCGPNPNLGWTDPFFAKDPALVKGAGAIDWVLHKRGHVELMPATARNYKDGMPGKCFYCTGNVTAYGSGASGVDPERISDHTAKLVKVFY
jgi:hypothetical protein